MTMHQLAICELVERVRSGETTAESIAESSLAAIERARGLNAFTHISRTAVLVTARGIDERRRAGKPLGRLAGVPIAIKDALCTVDAPTTCASRILVSEGQPLEGSLSIPGRGWQPPFDATVVARLRAEDALIIGKANLDEFAMGSSTENSAFGPTLNPWDLSRIPGGSSGGSAVAVAAQLTPVSLGSDTGGSIRQPAGLTGIVGLKPSYGRVSRFGLVAYASSLDQIGPFAQDVRSAARVLGVIAGHDPNDSTCADREVPDYEAACDRDVRGLRLGIPAEYFGEGLDPEINEAVKSSIEDLKRAGCTVQPVQLPHTRYGIATYYVLATAEASSNLSRFDGVRFGLRVEPPRGDLAALYGHTRDAGFGAEVKRRILLGTYVLSAGYYDAYYAQAQRVRTLIRRDFEAAFSQVDAIITPTSPSPAFKLGEHQQDPLAMYLEDVYTLPCNLAGLAGLSVPTRQTRATEQRPSLPVGVQLLAPAFGEETLFALGAALERAAGGFPRLPADLTQRFETLRYLS